MSQARAGQNRGEHLTLTCEVTGIPAPSVTPRRSRFGPCSQAGANTPVISRPLARHERHLYSYAPYVPSATAWRRAALACSQVPGRPLRTCPALRPRRTAAPQATTGTPMVPSAFTTASAPPCANFGAPSRGLHALCVRFEAGVTPGQRNTRFRLVASLGRAGLSPAGSHRWFTVMSFRLHGVLHHQALPGATRTPALEPESRPAPEARFGDGIAAFGDGFTMPLELGLAPPEILGASVTRASPTLPPQSAARPPVPPPRPVGRAPARVTLQGDGGRLRFESGRDGRHSCATKKHSVTRRTTCAAREG